MIAWKKIGMKNALGMGLLVFAAAQLGGCKIKKHLDLADANEADATFVLQYEHGFEHYVVQWDKAEEDALKRCAQWGYSAVEFSDYGTVECIEEHQRKVTGARPPSTSKEPGMGTEAAERERMRRSLGTVGKSITRAPPAGAEYGCIRWRVTYVGHCFD